MPEPAHRLPSADQLVLAYRIAWALNLRSNVRYSQTSDQEDAYMAIFGPLHDALRPIRPLLGRFDGWTIRIEQAFSALADCVDEFTKAWGWEGLAEPEPTRSKEVERRRVQFEELALDPYRQAALSWVRSAPRLSLGKSIMDLAEEAKQRGITSSTLALDEAEKRFRATERRRFEACCLGNRYPCLDVLGEESRAGWIDALRALDEELEPFVGSRGLMPWRPDEVSPATSAAGAADNPFPPPSDRSKAPEEERSEAAQLPRPKQYLFGWPEILDALGRKDSKEERARIKRLNELHVGPIITPGKGGQPKVDKVTLLEWWNGLEERFAEVAQRRADAQATIQAGHEYGRDGRVLPDISGDEKRRRTKG